MILSLTAGYDAAFLAGIFGICYVCYRSSHTLSPVRQQSLNRAVFLFSHLATGLVAAGLILGMVWTKVHVGRYVGGGGPREPYEIGAWCVMAWLIAVSAMQYFNQVSNRATMLMCIGGNVVVSLGWFGAAILASNPKMHSNGMGSHWLLAVFLGMNLCFLMMGLAPATATRRERQA